MVQRDIFKNLIKLKVEEIEKKFIKGEDLKIDEINILLSFSNSNEIENLTQNLNSIKDEVKKLKSEFEIFKLKSELENEKFKNEELKEREKLKNEFQKLELDIQKTLTNTMKWSSTTEDNSPYYYYEE